MTIHECMTIHVHVHSQPFSFHLTQTSITWWLKCYTFPTNMYRAHTLHSECVTSNKMLNINRRVRGRKGYAHTLSNNNVVKEEVSNSHAEPSPKNLLLHFSTYQFGMQVSWHCTRTWVQHKDMGTAQTLPHPPYLFTVCYRIRWNFQGNNLSWVKHLWGEIFVVQGTHTIFPPKNYDATEETIAMVEVTLVEYDKALCMCGYYIHKDILKRWSHSPQSNWKTKILG